MEKPGQIKTGFESSRTNPSERIEEHNQKMETQSESVRDTIGEARRIHETISAVGLQVAGGKESHSVKKVELKEIKDKSGMFDKARIMIRNIVSFSNEGKKDQTYKEVAGRIIEKEISKIEKELGSKVVKKKEELKKMVKEKEEKIKFLDEQLVMMKDFGGKDEYAELVAKVKEEKDKLDELISEKTQPDDDEIKLKDQVDQLIAPSLDKMKVLDDAEINYSKEKIANSANEKKCREILKEINKAKGKFDAGKADVKSAELEKVLNDRLAEAEKNLKAVEEEKAEIDNRLSKVRADKEEVGEYMHRLNCIGKTDKEKGVINKERNEKKRGSKAAIKDYVSSGRSDDHYWNWSSESSYGSFDDYAEGTADANLKLESRDFFPDWMEVVALDYSTELDFQKFAADEAKANPALKLDNMTEDQMVDIFSKFCTANKYSGKDQVLNKIKGLKKTEYMNTNGKDLEVNYRNTL